MADLTTDARLPRPEIEESGGCVTMRFLRANHVIARKSESGLTEQQSEILTLSHRSDHTLALREIHSLVGQQADRRRIRQDLAFLKSKGLIESTGHGRGARWKPL